MNSKKAKFSRYFWNNYAIIYHCILNLQINLYKDHKYCIYQASLFKQQRQTAKDQMKLWEKYSQSTKFLQKLHGSNQLYE